MRSLVMLTLAALAAGCGGGHTSSQIGVQNQNLGQAISGLPPAMQASFDRGRALMGRRFAKSEGLGPFYNATSCEACHSTPVAGGGSPAYRNFYLAAVGNPGFQSPIPTSLGPLPSLILPGFNTFTGARPTIPESIPPFFIVTTAQRNAPPMFGVGLFEFVTDATILSHSDPDDADGDGVSGRANRTSGPALNLGRFGYKAQVNNIESFLRGTLNNHMGITSNPVLGNGAIVTARSSFFGTELQVAGAQDQPITDSDGVGDPEINTQDLTDLITFSRFLAPPEPKAFTAAASHGEQLFDQIGCTKCHLPSLPSSIGPLKAYTDLLIHNMGSALADNIGMGTPEPSLLDPLHTGAEWRTQPLWGVSLMAPFLHDGRADTLQDAILLHSGEAQTMRDNFANLSLPDQEDLIAFLESL